MAPIDWNVIAPPRPAFEDLPEWAQREVAAQAAESDADYLRRLHHEQN